MNAERHFGYGWNIGHSQWTDYFPCPKYPLRIGPGVQEPDGIEVGIEHDHEGLSNTKIINFVRLDGKRSAERLCNLFCAALLQDIARVRLDCSIRQWLLPLCCPLG